MGDKAGHNKGEMGQVESENGLQICPRINDRHGERVERLGGRTGKSCYELPETWHKVALEYISLPFLFPFSGQSSRFVMSFMTLQNARFGYCHLAKCKV